MMGGVLWINQLWKLTTRDAWSEIKDMTPEVARKEYVDKLLEVSSSELLTVAVFTWLPDPR